MKTSAERVDEALADGMEWFKPACIVLIEAAVAEVRAEEEEKRQRWRRNVQDAVAAQIDETHTAGKAEGVTEERSRWLAWATDLGYIEQELPVPK